MLSQALLVWKHIAEGNIVFTAYWSDALACMHSARLRKRFARGVLPRRRLGGLKKRKMLAAFEARRPVDLSSAVASAAFWAWLAITHLEIRQHSKGFIIEINSVSVILRVPDNIEAALSAYSRCISPQIKLRLSHDVEMLYIIYIISKLWPMTAWTNGVSSIIYSSSGPSLYYILLYILSKASSRVRACGVCDNVVVRGVRVLFSKAYGENFERESIADKTFFAFSKRYYFHEA